MRAKSFRLHLSLGRDGGGGWGVGGRGQLSLLTLVALGLELPGEHSGGRARVAASGMWGGGDAARGIPHASFEGSLGTRYNGD